MRRLLFSFLMTCLCVGCASTQASPEATYYLVRHAEKVLDVTDPDLTSEGHDRARDLAERLKDIELTAVYSSDYNRTRQTAAPVAQDKSLDVRLYDPRDLESFAKKLLSEKGRILVVGHSNTTPQLAKQLGAEPGSPIVEATEYDRLYVIERYSNRTSGEQLSYGKSHE